MNELTVVKDATTIAQEIILLKDQANKYLLHQSIEIGRRLKEAKELVGHGNWGDWLEKEVDYSQRTASNLIKIYDEFGSTMLENPNSQSIANLGYTQAVAMLKLDFEERENFMLENDVSDMTTREIEGEIKDVVALREEKNNLEKLYSELEEKESKQAHELKDKLDKINKYENDIKTKNEEIMSLQNQLNNTSENDNSEELEKVKDDLKKKRDEVKNLKAQLKEKPTEVEVKVEKIVEVIPEEVEIELQNLRDELSKSKAKLNSSESISKFKAIFSTLMNQFNELLGVLGEIEKEEPEQYIKYKEAVNKLLDKLKIED